MNIYESIAAIMADAPAIGKGQKNQQQGFMYRGIDVVMNVFQPLLTKHKVFVVPQVIDSFREERKTAKGGNLIYTVLKVSYKFYAEDGSYIEAVVQGEGMDSADKSSNKAMSVAFKYAMFQVFCIPTEEMQDPDAETPPPSTKTAINTCACCGAELKPRKLGDKVYTPMDQAKGTAAKYGKVLCWDCAKRANESSAN